jgi:hypothetical protein
MLRTLPALLLLAAACSTTVATQSPAASPSSRSSPTAITIPVTTPPPAAATPLPTTPRFTLHCNLPVEDRAGGSGFLTFPGGDFSAAGAPPASIPEIGGYYTQTYDWPYSKWLPVGPMDISPDGSKYAYQGNDRVLKVVDVVSGTATPIPASSGWNLIGTANDGVYAHTFLGRSGLWFLRYAGGDPIQVSQAGYSYLAVGGGHAYASSGKDDQTLLQVDLKTGTATKFADPPAQILGFDSSGAPVVRLASSLVLMAAPYQQKVVVPDQAPPGFVIGDRNGIWFPLADGIYLATPDGRVTQMSSQPGGLVEGVCR